MQKTGPTLTIYETYTVYNVFLRKQLPFWGCDDSKCVKIFSGVHIFNLD